MTNYRINVTMQLQIRDYFITIHDCVMRAAHNRRLLRLTDRLRLTQNGR